MAQPEYADRNDPPSNYNIDPQTYWENRATQNIKQARKGINELGDLGESQSFRVMIDTIAEGCQNPDGTINYTLSQNKPPIYIFSDDTTSHRLFIDSFFDPMKEELDERLAFAPVVSTLTVGGFMRALGEKDKGNQNSMLQAMGFREGPEDALHAIFDEDSWYLHAWNSRLRDAVVMAPNDSNPPQFPFGMAIRQLRRELDCSEGRGKPSASGVVDHSITAAQAHSQNKAAFNK